jgi:hypothetical protein
LERVFANDPEDSAVHFSCPHLAERSYQAFNDRGPELGELLDHLFHERDDVNGRGVVEICNKI